MKTDQHLERITTLSRRLRFALRVILVLALVALVTVLFGLGSGAGTATVDIGGAKIDLGRVPGAGWLLVFGLIVPFFAVVLALLYQADRLLGLYQRGQIFAAENGHRIRRAGQLLIALWVLEIIVVPLVMLVANRVGPGLEEVSIDVDLGLLLAGIFVIVIGHVMSIGAELAEDQALTI